MMIKPFTTNDIALMLDMDSRGIPANVIADAFYDASDMDIIVTLARVKKEHQEYLDQRQALDDAHEQSVRESYRARGYHNIY